MIVKSGDTTLATRDFAAGQQEVVSVEGIAAKLRAGDNQLRISLSGDNQMPYVLNVSYRSRQPASDPRCAVRLTTTLNKQTVKAGQTVSLSANLSNNTPTGQPMTIAILGLPAGLEPRTSQLDDLKKAGKIDYYETRPREIICYWRALAPERKVQLHVDLIAEIPGKFTGPASRAYLYYTAEQKQWTPPLAIEITRE